MTNNKISSRYAMSLMDLTQERNNLDSVYQNVRSVISAFEQSSELRRVLVNPVIKPKIKISILDEIFGGRIDAEVLKFIRFIVEKNREEYLFAIMKRFTELRNEKLGIAEVEVKTAADFSESQKNELKTNLENMLNKTIQLHFIMDEKVLGGFVARVGDTLYDASIRNQLDNLKKEFLRGSTL